MMTTYLLLLSNDDTKSPRSLIAASQSFLYLFHTPCQLSDDTWSCQSPSLSFKSLVGRHSDDSGGQSRPKLEVP